LCSRAPQFIAGDTLDLDKTIETDEDAEDQQDAEESMDEESSSQEEEGDDDEEKPPSPRIREETPPETGPRGGLGLGMAGASAAFQRFASTSSMNNETPKPTGRAGIGSSAGSSVASSFGKAQERQQAFVREDKPAPRPVPVAHLTATDRAAFASYRGSIGQRLMAKMGYQEVYTLFECSYWPLISMQGTGLGPRGEGIVTPVESKLRPKNAGIAFKGFEEKTNQAKAEAKRKARRWVRLSHLFPNLRQQREGKISDEDEPIIITQDGKQKKRSDAWRKKAKPKTKVEHKTYEEIIAESSNVQAQLPEKIIDATGAVVNHPFECSTSILSDARADKRSLIARRYCNRFLDTISRPNPNTWSSA
jgi:tuftelin-interacting protein 11